jgi:ornithine cyclodeaminase
MRLVDGEELRSALSMTAAIDALEAAFGSEDPASAGPVRSSVDTPGGALLLMPARGPRGVGVKIVTLTDANPAAGLPLVQAAYVLFDAETQEPEAVLDGTELTALRTGAVSGLATRYLARPEARRLVVFGAGTQASSHLEAMMAVRPVEDVVVVSRGAARAEAFVERARASGLAARLGTQEDVTEADLVCTCTTSSTPVVAGALVPEGVHINAVGAYLPDARELDTDAVRRARTVVETREVAFEEAGDLLVPIAEGAIDASHVVADLAAVVRGAPVRRSAQDVTLFKGVGMAFEDLVVARAALDAIG